MIDPNLQSVSFKNNVLSKSSPLTVGANKPSGIGEGNSENNIIGSQVFAVSKARKLRQMLMSGNLEYLMEAHSGISAKIVEDAGFKGIWASGLAISASLGVRDCNEASWTQVTDILEFMSDATSIPILLDGDTGYGNFNNMQRLVKKLEQRQIAGVCIEDKVFPKSNSLLVGQKQSLADIDEFCGKIKAGKDAQMDPDFNIVARIEAFIAGWGVDEALKRARAYAEAGADAILVHSRKSTAEEIVSFMKAWDGRIPVVIVPTNYHTEPKELFQKIGVSVVIWANHTIRSSVKMMKQVVTQIHRDCQLNNVENEIVSVSEIFRLQGMDHLNQAEEKYLPKGNDDIQAVILGGNPGVEMGSITKDKPKCMVEINGTPILSRLVHQMRMLGISKINVLRGYKKEAINFQNVDFIDNPEYSTTKGAYYLSNAIEKLKGSLLICYGDSLFQPHLIEELLKTDANIAIVVDANISKSKVKFDWVKCDKPYRNCFYNNDVKVVDIGVGNDESDFDGEWTGMLLIRQPEIPVLKDVLLQMRKDPEFSQMGLADVIKKIAKTQDVTVIYTKGGWLDVDFLTDVSMAEKTYA